MKTMKKTSRVFSVIALVLCLMMVLGITAFAAETENATEGEVIEIRTWDDLKALDARVEGGDLMEGVTVKLMNDIDLYEMGEDGEPVTFNPIGANTAYFKGTFDGQGHTIKNMYQSGWALDYHWDNYGTIGLFAYLWNATIKDVTIENAECFVEGGNVAAIAGCAWGDCTFENITVKNSTFATYNNRAGGIVGYTGGSGTFTFKDITVDEDTVIAGLWGSFDSSLGGVMGQLQSASQAVFENVRVACRLDAYNDVTAAYKYYAYRMCGMLIGRIPVDDNNQPILNNVTIGDNVVIDYSGMPDYTYTNATGSWKRVEAGYAYDGVDMTQYPEAEVIYKPLNSMLGGQQYGSYGQDDHEDIVAEGRVASFDGEYFTSLENAIKAADGAKDNEGNAIPVILMADYDKDIVITESLNLDLNGYAFTGNVTTVDGKKVVFEDGKYTAVETPKINVATKAELNAALAAANDGDVIVLTADIDYGTDQLKIEKAITLDLGGYTLTTRNAWGGMSVKNDATVKNGTIVHASNTAAIKVWNATAFENLVIDVQGKGDAGKTIGGIVLQSGTTTRVGSIKDVTIKGAALTNGIETYNCGDATENVIGSMENVTITAKGTGMLISAPCGTATNCTISGDINGIEIWIKGNYSATLSLVDSKVEGGVYAHDEFNNNAGVVNNGTLSFTVDEATEVDDVTLTLARAENVEGELKEIKDNAQAKVNNTYYATIADAIKAANAGDVVTVFAGTYAMPSMKAGITIVGEGEVVFEGTLSGTLENLTLKNIYIKGGNAQRWAYAKGDLVFENVTFHATSVYALHFDGITAGATLTYKDCTIIGWAAMSGSPESCVFDGCTFKGNGTYGVIRTYFDATIENCTFDVANVNTTDVYQDGIHAVSGAEVTVNNCTNDNGEMAAIVNVSDSAAVVLDGAKIQNAAKFGDNYYATFEQAINAAFATAYANNGAKQTVYTVAGEKYAELGTWGGIDWTLAADGTLTIAPTKGTPVADKNAPTKRTYEVGEWRETVIYKSNGSASEIGGTPYDMKAVKKLIIEEGVTTIGSFTCQFPNLTGEVVIPSTVTYIGQEAFHKTPITKLTFAAGGTEGLCIANGAFKKTLITEVSFPGDREYIHIHHWAFGGSTKLETAYIPANVTKCWGGEHVDYFDNFNSQTNPSWTYTSSPFTGCTAMQTITFENEAVRDLFFGSNRNSTAEDPMVAYAGLTAYNTFAEALEAALENGVTLGLAKNVTVKDTIVIPAGKTLTINLNGKTISQSKACTESYEMILNKGSLTITGNGKISFTDTSAGDPNFGWGSYTIRNEGTLVVENGTIEHKGAQAFATHMICAIFQYSGSTTINGGTISTPNYRSVRLWKGDMTINGGTFDGQVWVQAVDNSAKLTINGGTFEPNGQDASSVFVSNATYDVEFAVTDGTFNGKIGANDATKLAGSVANGRFNENAKNGTNVDLLSEGYIFGNLTDEYYSVVEAVAQIGETKYETLADAIKAATAGQTITFLTDITEDVTINKNLTIDGAEKNYTGTMTINNVTVTIDNVNFVKGQVYKNKNTGTTANITIKNCDFDGQGMNAYAINLGGTKSIVIENVTAKDYGYGLLQVPSSCAGLTVKNVTVSGCYYGMKVDYANAVTIENANIDATVGVYDSNFGTKTYTIKDSKISSISIWQRNTTNYTTFKFEGVNEVATLSTSAYAKYTGVQIGTKIYDSLANAWVAAQDGDTIKLLGDIAIDTAITNTKKITLDLNGKTITGTDNATGSFAIITNKGELTITGNGKITLTATNDRDWNAYSSVISNTVGGKLVVENGTIEHLGGTDMAYAIDNLTNGKGTYAETVINGGTIKSTYRAIRMFLNGVEAQNILTVNGGTIEGDNKSIWVQDPSKNNNTGKITVAAGAVLNGDVYLYATAGSAEWPVEVSIAASAVNGEVITGNMPNGYILEKRSGNWTVNEYIAKVGNKYYKSLQAAVDAANQYQSVTLLQDAEGAGVVINKKTTIDFNGFTYAVNTPVGSTGTESNGFQILAGNYTVRLLNGTLKVADSAADKFYILVQNYADLIVQKMTLDGTNLDKYAFTDGDSYTLSNNSGNVQINTSKIIANNDGDKAFAFDACDQTKNGYELPKIVVYTSSTIEGKIEAAAKVGTAYYATLEQAIDATAEGKTITLLAPVVVNAGETLNLNKAVTISYTSKVAGEDMITVRGTLIVDGATLVYNNKDVTGSNVTVSTISAEPGSVVEIKSGVVKNNSANNGAKGIYAYAIDMLTNGNMGDVTVTISGGEVISTNYMAIRQFNNGTACKNTLTVTGGYIYGAKRAIQIHMDNDAAYLTISGGTIEAGDYALCLFPKNATNVAVIGGKFIGTIYSGTNGFITGGTFDEAVYEGYITESYKQVKVDGVYNVIFDETYGSVATIGDKKFNSFASAWEAAQNGDTIVLQNNITIDTETFTVADGKKITLDMNGYTITVTDNSTKNYELFYIYGEMVVTGKGTIELTATNNRAWNASSGIFHNRGGVLTIENGTFTHNGGSDMAFVVDNSGNWFGDAITNINGGTLTSSYIAIRNRMEQNTHGASGKAILNVYGGKINGISRAIWAQAASTSTVAPATGEINVYGGEIGLIDTARSAGAVCMTTITGGTVASFKGESGELKVNGGKITGDITILFADGTAPVKTVVKSKVYYGAVAKMGSSYFATFEDALKKCTGAQAITLLRDIEGEGFVITGKTAIDFNGYTYTVTAPVAGTNVGVQINASGKTVRLINGTLTAAEGSGVEVLVENNSTLTIQRQTLAVTSGTALLVKGGSASINIATINAEGAVAFEVVSGKITVYSEGKSSFINGEKLAKKSGTSYVAK